MNQFKGKRLLILGANVTECFIVKSAHELGIYTIVTDNNTDRTKSPAKQISDEYWDISWSDIDSLVSKCNDCGVDGVIAGFSEFRVESQIALCERLNLPCPITMEQLDFTRDKVKFKDVCRIVDLPVVPEFSEIDAFENLPVIVKPVDRAGSIGISVAFTKEELLVACEKAVNASPSGKIIIEKYMDHCIKFDLYYLISNGEVFLLGSNDTLMCPPNKGHEILQSAWIFPSYKQQRFVEKHGEEINKFFKYLNIRNGYITISAFVDENDNFFIFETGFRLSGELSFEYTKYAYGYNYLDFLIEFAFRGIQDRNFMLPPKKSEIPLLVLNHYANDGEIVSKKHLSVNCESYWIYDYLKDVNCLHNDNGNGVSKVAMSFIPVESIDKVARIIDSINEELDVIGKDNCSLIYNRITDVELKKLIQ